MQLYLKNRKCLKAHTNSIHDGIKYPCNQCEYTGNRKDNLTTHVDSICKVVHLKCNQCDLTLAGKSSLEGHINAVHSKIHCKQKEDINLKPIC